MKKLLALTLACALVSAPVLKAEKEDLKDRLAAIVFNASQEAERAKHKKIKDFCTSTILFGALGILMEDWRYALFLQGFNVFIHHKTLGELLAAKLHSETT